jgi:hypothetical protein
VLGFEQVHPLFVASDHPPVAPGASPFHFKGFYYDRLFSRLRGTPGSMERLLSELKDDRVREFAAQRFSWNGWYDALPSMPIFAALARIEDTDITTYVRNYTRTAAASLVPGLFRFTMDIGGGPGVIAAVVTRFVMQTVDFASPRFESIGAERAVAKGTGIPLYIAPNIAGLVLGWFEGVLRSSGAEEAVGEFGDVVVQSRPDAYDSVSMRFDFRWRLDARRMSQSRSSSRLAAVITNRLTKVK